MLQSFSDSVSCKQEHTGHTKPQTLTCSSPFNSTKQIFLIHYYEGTRKTSKSVRTYIKNVHTQNASKIAFCVNKSV